MRHFFRVNVSPEGYCLYAGHARQTLRPQPLGIESRDVPGDYLRAQSRIDAILKTRQVSWSLAIQRADESAGPVVAYGCHVSAPDDRGRQGLSFVHGIELENANQVVPCVLAVLRQIGATSGRQILEGVTGLAVRVAGVTPQEFLSHLASSLEDYLQTHEVPLPSLDTQAEISVIAQDCVGGQAEAWLTLAAQQAAREPPWSVYDVVGKDGLVSSRVEPTRGEKARASELLFQRRGCSTREPEDTPVNKAQFHRLPRPPLPLDLREPEGSPVNKAPLYRSVRVLVPLSALVVIVVALVLTVTFWPRRETSLAPALVDVFAAPDPVKGAAERLREEPGAERQLRAILNDRTVPGRKRVVAAALLLKFGSSDQELLNYLSGVLKNKNADPDAANAVLALVAEWKSVILRQGQVHLGRPDELIIRKLNAIMDLQELHELMKSEPTAKNWPDLLKIEQIPLPKQEN